MVKISNVNNKYLAALESSYGVSPSPFTEVDWGHIQTFSVNEEENPTKERGINSGHTAALFEDGLYWANVSITTKATKASLPTLLEFCLGAYSDDGTDYTISSDNETTVSYSFKISYDGTNVILVNGFVVKDFEISIARNESVSFTINGIAKKAAKSAETISPTKNTDEIFKWIDTSVTVGGNNYVLNSFSLSGNWNVTDDEGRGIENVGAGERRLIQAVIRHGFDVSGSFEAEVDTNDEFGYTDERSDEAIVLTVSRGTDNEHVFTMSNTRSFTRGLELTNENEKRVVSRDYEALDVGVTGDL